MFVGDDRLANLLAQCERHMSFSAASTVEVRNFHVTRRLTAKGLRSKVHRLDVPHDCERLVLVLTSLRRHHEVVGSLARFYQRPGLLSLSYHTGSEHYLVNAILIRCLC